MQYSIPITINHRREIIASFFPTIHADNNSHFIVEMAETDAIEIVQINAKNSFTCFVENDYDIAFENLDIDATIQGDLVSIIIKKNNTENIDKTMETEKPKKEFFYDDIINATAPRQNTVEQKPIQSTTNNVLKILGNINPQISIGLQKNASGIVITAQHASPITAKLFDSNSLQVKFILQINEQEFLYQFSVSIAHPSQYIGMALDFGSESSQMATKRYEVGNVIYEDKPNIENLFQQIKLFYTNNKWLEKNGETNREASYYQEEKGSNFYKSLFFLREHLTDEYEDIDACDFIKSQQENLELLIDTNSMQSLVQDKFYQLPNLKIIHKHNDILSSIHFEFNDNEGNVLPLTLKEMKQKINNTILKTMVESFLQKEFLRYKTATRFVRLLLLVPNIYDSNNIQYVKLQLHKIFAELANTGAYSGKLLAWEVLTISESDASFIGYINRKNAVVNKNKDYIIVDVGKGTTDFSIIKTGAENIFDLQPIYRNGFAGAGNLITNAIFETILRYIREASAGQSGVNKFISDKIIGSLHGDDLVRLRTFYEEIERLKFNFKTENIDAVLKDWASAEKLGNTFANIASKDVEFQTIIDLLGQLENGADFFGYINDVCEIITEKVLAHLRMIQQNKTDSSFDGVILTGRGFMFAPLANMMKQKMNAELKIEEQKIVLLNGSELKDICIKGVFNKAIQQNTDVIGAPIQIVKGEKTEAIQAPKISNKKWYEFLIGSIESNTNDVKVVIKKDANVQMNGLQNSEFIIGANAYSFGNKSIGDNVSAESKATINFTNTGCKVRRMLHGKVEKIIPLTQIHDYDEVELRLIIPSLFPNYIDKKYLKSLQDELIGLPKQQATIEPHKSIPPAINPLLFDGNTSNTPPPFNDLLF
jgi:hypothetical protein